jgi:hypothetical protein
MPPSSIAPLVDPSLVPPSVTPTAVHDEEAARRAIFARAQGRGSIEVARTDLGDEWPLTVDHGTLRCVGTGGLGRITFDAPNGRTYAVNGLARSARGARDIDPIWAPDPDPILTRDGARISIGTLIQLGVALCNR